MPLFDFLCTDCGHMFERLISKCVSGLECPNCGAVAEKQVSAPAPPQFKGSGFYATDYKGKK